MDCNGCNACNHRCMPGMVSLCEGPAPCSGGVPIAMSSAGDSGIVTRLTGDKEIRLHLISLGFNPGSVVSIIRKQNEDLIVEIKGSRLAMGPAIARRIYFLPGVLK